MLCFARTRSVSHKALFRDRTGKFRNDKGLRTCEAVFFPNSILDGYWGLKFMELKVAEEVIYLKVRYNSDFLK